MDVWLGAAAPDSRADPDLGRKKTRDKRVYYPVQRNSATSAI